MGQELKKGCGGSLDPCTPCCHKLLHHNMLQGLAECLLDQGGPHDFLQVVGGDDRGHMKM